MKFEQYPIHEGIKKNLALKGFRRPTDIQFKAIPHILAGEDVLAVAQTGTGKTAAFAIPLVHLLDLRKKQSRSDAVRCLVMTPTHELAQQVAGVFEDFAKNTRVDCLAVHGGVEQDAQIDQLREGVDVVVATPGRVFDLVSQGHLRLDRVEVLVLDEADHMLAKGFYKDIRDLLRHLPRKRQTLFFSATIDEEIKDLAYSLVSKPIRIQISPKDPVSKNVDHAVAFIEMDHKRFFLERVLKTHPESKVLVFTRTKVRAERVKAAMERVEISALTLHSDIEQAERERVMALFRSGEARLLVATDISARGIDIPNVELVINYDLPDLPENYVHRVGRTGRGQAHGKAVTFCSPEEKPTLEIIQSFLGKDIVVLDIHQDDYRATLDFSEQPDSDWKSLMEEADKQEVLHKKRVARKATKKARKP